jgi:hypothetical protein
VDPWEVLNGEPARQIEAVAQNGSFMTKTSDPSDLTRDISL